MKKLCYEHKSLHIFLTVKNTLFAPFCKRDTKKKDVGHQKSASSECKIRLYICRIIYTGPYKCLYKKKDIVLSSFCVM